MEATGRNSFLPSIGILPQGNLCAYDACTYLASYCLLLPEVDARREVNRTDEAVVLESLNARSAVPYLKLYVLYLDCEACGEWRQLSSPESPEILIEALSRRYHHVLAPY